MTAPVCPSCNAPARLTTGKEIYPRRTDLHLKPIWKCDGCGAYVGCHPGTTTALGVPADADTRKARMLLHNDMLDPIWKNADRLAMYHPKNDEDRNKIRRVARGRVYAYLGAHMGIAQTEVHTGNFTVEQCRLAWRCLKGLSYLQIRDWAHRERGKS